MPHTNDPHIMIDIETLGTKPGCVVLSIGAVTFLPAMLRGDNDPGVINTYYANIAILTCLQAGLTVDNNTLEWWGKQDPRLIEALHKDVMGLKPALEGLSAFIAIEGATRIWCHGATFDVPILEAAYKAVGLPVPWKFYNVRDTRTCYEMADVEPDRSVGLHHNALDDAKAQALAVQVAYSHLGIKA